MGLGWVGIDGVWCLVSVRGGGIKSRGLRTSLNQALSPPLISRGWTLLQLWLDSSCDESKDRTPFLFSIYQSYQGLRGSQVALHFAMADSMAWEHVFKDQV